MKVYKSYLFRDKDPAIDALRTLAQDHFGTRALRAKELAQIEHLGGPAAATMYAWFEGATRRPQNATIEAAGRALGYHRVWRKREAQLRLVRGSRS